MSLLEMYKVTAAEMRSRSRLGVVNEARQMHWYLLWEKGMRCEDIARTYNRDRVTVMHGVNRISGLIQVDPDVRRKYYALRADDTLITFRDDFCH
jgi:chromosomal replication initiation ATPase DnaA